MAAFQIIDLRTASDQEAYSVAIQEERTVVVFKRSMHAHLRYERSETVELLVHDGVTIQLFQAPLMAGIALVLTMTLKPGSTVRQLVLPQQAGYQINEQYQLEEHARLYSAFGELCADTNVHQSTYHLVGRFAKLESTFVYMNAGTSHKTTDITVYHHVKDTSANVENYGVVAGKSKLLVNVDSKIVKGASGSETHQTSRILTFDEGVHARVLPALHIDENDVKASHACSMGVIDENHLYYLQSRGLTRSQAVQLIVSGYLSPLSEIFDGDELKEEISHIIDTKAGEYVGLESNS